MRDRKAPLLSEEAVGLYDDKKDYILIIYDIIDDRRRLKLVKLLNAYGNRIQKSAFEAILHRKLYNKLLADISSFFVDGNDSIRVYHMNGHGEEYVFGEHKTFNYEELIIV